MDKILWIMAVVKESVNIRRASNNYIYYSLICSLQSESVEKLHQFPRTSSNGLFFWSHSLNVNQYINLSCVYAPLIHASVYLYTFFCVSKHLTLLPFSSSVHFTYNYEKYNICSSGCSLFPSACWIFYCRRTSPRFLEV